MRVLGIETSSVRGSVALVADGACVCSLEHERENAHAESILPLVERALAQAGWRGSELSRVAVGLGPGSFTGLRVGIAVAQGLSEGLQIPLVGVRSLEAMARAVPVELPGVRCVLADARKGEWFVAGYEAGGRELLPAQLVRGIEELRALCAGWGATIHAGQGAALMAGLGNIHRSRDSDYPHARWTARIAEAAEPAGLVRPLYVRDAVAVVPRLPNNPLRPLPST